MLKATALLELQTIAIFTGEVIYCRPLYPSEVKFIHMVDNK